MADTDAVDDIAADAVGDTVLVTAAERVIGAVAVPVGVTDCTALGDCAPDAVPLVVVLGESVPVGETEPVRDGELETDGEPLLVDEAEPDLEAEPDPEPEGGAVAEAAALPVPAPDADVVDVGEPV